MNNSQESNPEPKRNAKSRFKEKLKVFNIIGYENKQKLLIKYGEALETALDKAKDKRELQKTLKEELGSYFPRIVGAWEQYRDGEINTTAFVTSGILTLRMKFIDVFIKESKVVHKVRRRNVYLTLLSIFGAMVGFCLFYFLLLMPVDVSKNPEGNFIFPGPENFEWVFTIIMAVLMITLFGYLASTVLSRMTLKIYIKTLRKNQKIGLVPTDHLFGAALYRKLLSRALIGSFLAFNIAIALASNIVYIAIMRSPNPSAINLVPDPELMIQSLWIAAIPVIILLVPLWLMMDIGLAKTKVLNGYTFESVNLAGNRFYRFIKGYASISFVFNLIIIIFVWSSDDVPFIRILMRFISPAIVFSFLFPLVVLIDHKNEIFKKKLWSKLQKFDINQKLEINVKEKQITDYHELMEN